MIWQDLVLMIVSISFVYALIPQVYQSFKKKKPLINIQTAIINSLGMLIVAFVYFSLNLYFSATISFITSSLWFVTFIQNLKYN